MNFFVDFEAHQPSGRILSIGCTAYQDETFYVICKSPKDKVSDFITNLTGITEDMVNEIGVDYNEAFTQFFDYIEMTQTDEKAPKFYVYGHEDANFLKTTLHYLTSPKAYAAAAMVLAGMVDLSQQVCQHLMTNGISLRRAIELVRQETVVQRHNALDDALMLEELAANFKNLEPINDKPIHNKSYIEAKAKENNYRQLAQSFIDGKYRRDNAPTGDETNWAFKWSYKGKDKYFSDTMIFGVWYARYFQNVAKTNIKAMKMIDTSIQSAIKNGHPTWKKHNLTINTDRKENE